jgi:hypothetical protein
MRNAALARSYVPEIAQVADVHLAKLQESHRDLLAQMANMEAITSEGDYEVARLANGRWKISHASLVRRTLASRICEYLLPRCEAAEILALKDLQAADRDFLRASADHVGKWRAEQIAADWRGYCRASREVRRRMHAHIAVEQRVLYGILERAVRLGG